MYKCIKFMDDISKYTESYLTGLEEGRREIYFFFGYISILVIMCIMLHWRRNQEPGVLRSTVEYSTVVISIISMILLRVLLLQ